MENTTKKVSNTSSAGYGASAGTTTSLNTAWGGTYYVGDYTPAIQTWYPGYSWCWSTPSKIEQSFKIVQKLLEKKVIKEPKTIKDFIELVNVISDVI